MMRVGMEDRFDKSQAYMIVCSGVHLEWSKFTSTTITSLWGRARKIQQLFKFLCYCRVRCYYFFSSSQLKAEVFPAVACCRKQNLLAHCTHQTSTYSLITYLTHKYRNQMSTIHVYVYLHATERETMTEKAERDRRKEEGRSFSETETGTAIHTYRTRHTIWQTYADIQIKIHT